MNFRCMIVFILAAFVLSCQHSQTTKLVSAGYIGDGDYTTSPEVMELISEHALITPGGHAYLYMKRGKGKEKPTLESVADIKLSIYDATNQLVNSDETQVSLKSSLPLVKDMVRQMVVGDKVRVWGDSYLRVWEIELLGFQNPMSNEILAKGPEKPPEEGDKAWVVTKNTKNERLKDGQIVHVQFIHWKEKDDGSLVFEESKDYILEINKHVLAYYYDMFRAMAVGERARAWHLNRWEPKDSVYDIWVIDRYPQYETPELLNIPKGDDTITFPNVTYAKKLLYRPKDAKPVADQYGRIQAFEISVNCWDQHNGGLVATSDMSSFGWSQGVTTSFWVNSFLYSWCSLLDLDRYDKGDFFSSTCEHEPDYEAYQRELDDRKAGKPSQIVRNKRRPRGFVYYHGRLTNDWVDIMKDAAYGDIFMLWRDNASMFRHEEDDDPNREEWSESLLRARDMDVACRIEIGINPPETDSFD